MIDSFFQSNTYPLPIISTPTTMDNDEGQVEEEQHEKEA